MLMCPRCGKLVEEEDLEVYFEFHGHDGLAPIKEPMTRNTCDECGWEYEEAEKCKVCGEYFIPEDYKYSVCEECMEDYETIEIALAIGEYNKATVHINGFVDFDLTEAEINEVLVNYVKNKKIPKGDAKIKEYCEDDKDYFGDWIVEEIEREKARTKNG